MYPGYSCTIPYIVYHVLYTITEFPLSISPWWILTQNVMVSKVVIKNKDAYNEFA